MLFIILLILLVLGLGLGLGLGLRKEKFQAWEEATASCRSKNLGDCRKKFRSCQWAHRIKMGEDVGVILARNLRRGHSAAGWHHIMIPSNISDNSLSEINFLLSQFQGFPALKRGQSFHLQCCGENGKCDIVNLINNFISQ
jgi:hypothetical protein